MLAPRLAFLGRLFSAVLLLCRFFLRQLLLGASSCQWRLGGLLLVIIDVATDRSHVGQDVVQFLSTIGHLQVLPLSLNFVVHALLVI